MKFTTSMLFAVLFLFACSEKLPMEDLNLNLKQEITANSDESFVTSKQAAEIAEKFLSKEPGAATRSFASARVETVRDAENGNAPAMHAVIYPEGGFVIVSATKDYFPVLAYSDENPFDMEVALQSGVSVWLEETKAYITP